MAELIETYRGTVYPWHCDHMGHMNVMWYVGKFDEATWNFFAQFGVSAAWLRANDRGMAAVEQKIAYRRELFAGDTVVVRSGLVELREKAARFVHEMLDAQTGEIAAVTLLTGLQIDGRLRKACAFPADILARARGMVVDYELPAGW